MNSITRCLTTKKSELLDHDMWLKTYLVFSNSMVCVQLLLPQVSGVMHGWIEKHSWNLQVREFPEVNGSICIYICI